VNGDAQFDKAMNGLPLHLVPTKHCTSAAFSEWQAIAADRTLSYALTKALPVMYQDPAFGILIASGELNNCAYVSYIKSNTAAANMFSSDKASLHDVNGNCIVSINNKSVFAKDNWSCFLSFVQ